MKNTKTCIIVILILFFSIPNLLAQKTLPDDRDVIAGNIEQLLKNFTASLSFEITLDDEAIKQIDAQLNSLNDSIPQQFIDSIRIVKIDSLKEIERNKLREKFLNNFVLDDDVPSATIWNFAFDSVLNPQKTISVNEFSALFFGIYNQIQGLEPPTYMYRDFYLESLLSYSESATIEKENGTYIMFVPFSIGWFEGLYDTTSTTFKQLPLKVQEKLKLTNSFSSREIAANIELSAIVQFNKPDDANSYRIKSLSASDEIVVHPEIHALLNKDNGIIEKLKQYMPLDPALDKIDPAIVPSLLELFENPDKKALECALFFTDELCSSFSNDTGDIINISANQYCKYVQMYYSAIGTFDINIIPNEIQKKKGNGYDIVKVPVKTSYVPYLKEESGFEAVPLDHSKTTNFYFKLDYEKSMVPGRNKDVEYVDAKITDIAAYNKTIKIPQPDSKGSFSLSANYSPFYHQFLIDKDSDFSDFSNQFYPSHSFGLEGAYYWFGKKEKNLLGVSVGLYYDIIKSGIYVDTVYYANAYTGTQNPTGEPVEKYEEQVWLSDFSQTIKLNQISIPVQFNYMTRMQSKSLFNLGFGGRISFIGKGSVETKQEEGAFTRKGYYEIKFPDGTDGSYVLEDIEDAPYYYFTNKNIAYVQEHPENDLNTTAIYLQVNPSFAIPISEKNKQLYLNLGLNFQYGLTPLYNNNESGSIMGAADESNSGFVYGIKDQNYAFGITIGLRYFNAVKEQKNEIFQFK